MCVCVCVCVGDSETYQAGTKMLCSQQEICVSFTGKRCVSYDYYIYEYVIIVAVSLIICLMSSTGLNVAEMLSNIRKFKL